jgi:hypothetical protein
MSDAISPLPQYAFMAWCLVKKQRLEVSQKLYSITSVYIITLAYWIHFAGIKSAIAAKFLNNPGQKLTKKKQKHSVEFTVSFWVMPRSYNGREKAYLYFN